MPDNDIRVHEVTFCCRVAKWADALFAQHPEWPFKRTEIEESTGANRKRSNLRVYGSRNTPILAGEVKLPGGPEGRDACTALVEDSFRKASDAGAEFFFTWNVNKFALFDAKLWRLPIVERRVKDYDLGLDLDNREAVFSPEVERAVRDFLAMLFSDLAAILAGKQPDRKMPLRQVLR
jgi:hypothetical protein